MIRGRLVRLHITRVSDSRSRHRRTIAEAHFLTVESVTGSHVPKGLAMTYEPTTNLRIAASRHRARVHDAALRHVAAAAPSRHWVRRPTRSFRHILP